MKYLLPGSERFKVASALEDDGSVLAAALATIERLCELLRVNADSGITEGQLWVKLHVPKGVVIHKDFDAALAAAMEEHDEKPG